MGGAIALVGSFIYAELADRMPQVGVNMRLRTAYHPAVGFLYGWVALLVIHAGGTAAVVVTFAKYFQLVLTGDSEKITAVTVIVALTVVNCMGVRAGGTVQSVFMIFRILAISTVVLCGAWFIWGSPAAPHIEWQPLSDRPASFGLLSAFGAAMVPVLFGYGGWQTSNYMAGEIRDPRKNLPRALVLESWNYRALPHREFCLCPGALPRDSQLPDASVASYAPGIWSSRLSVAALIAA